MTTSTFTIDKDIREQALKRAKKEKLSLSFVARILLKDYADGKISIGSKMQESYQSKLETIEVDEETQAKMDEVFTLWNKKRKGK